MLSLCFIVRVTGSYVLAAASDFDTPIYPMLTHLMNIPVVGTFFFISLLLAVVYLVSGRIRMFLMSLLLLGRFRLLRWR